MSPISRQFLCLAVCILLAAAVAPAFAATTEPPDNIAEALAEAARACKDMEGKPNTAPG